MKKALTLFAAVAMLVGMGQAQQNLARRTDGGTAKARLAMPAKAVHPTPLAFKAVGDTVSTFPWTESFDDGTATGFSFVDADGDGNNWTVWVTGMTQNNLTTHTGAGCAYSASWQSQTVLTPDNWMLLPVMVLGAADNNFTLTWWELGQDANYAAEHYSVYVISANDTVSLFDGISTAEWVKRTVDLSAYAGQTIRIAFRHWNSTDMFMLNIDDLRVGPLEPPVVHIDGLADIEVNTPATFAATGAASYIWSIDGTVQAATGDTLTHTFAATGAHYVALAAQNTAGFGYDTLHINVFSCDEAIAAMPWDEGFEGNTDCWTLTPADSGDYTMVYPSANYAHAGNNFLYLYDDDDADQWAVSPAIRLPDSAAGFVLKYYIVIGERNGVLNRCQVRLSTTGADTASFTHLLNDDHQSTNNDYAPRNVDLSAYAGQTVRIAFRNVTPQGGYGLQIDDIHVGLPPLPDLALASPENVRTNEPYTFHASSDVDSLVWTVDTAVVTAYHGNALTHIFTTAGSHTVKVSATNTTGTVDTTVAVMAWDCSPNPIPYTADLTDGIGICWDNSGWDTISMGNTTGIYSMSNLYGFFDLDPDNWIVTPAIAMPESGNYQVEWSVLAYEAQMPSDHYGVYAIASGDTMLLFEETLTADMADAPSLRTAALPAGLTGTFKVAFRHFETTGGYIIVVSDIKVGPLTAPVVTLAGPTRVEQGFEATFTAVSGSATGYTWTVDGAAVAATGAVLTHTFATAGNHTVSVVATNSVGSSQPAAATVAVYSCSPVAAFPWVEGFEGNTECWHFVNNDGEANGFYVFTNQGQYNYSYNGSHCLMGAYNDFHDVDQWAVSPAIVLPANTDGYTLRWHVIGTEYEGVVSSYEVRLSHGGTAFSDFGTLLHSETGATDNRYAHRSVSLADYAGQTVRIAFRNVTAAGGDALLLDDIKISDAAGIDQANTASVAVYPNPATEMLSVEGDGILQVRVLDINGRTVAESQAAGQIAVGHLASGMYIVRVLTANGVHNERLVKE